MKIKENDLDIIQWFILGKRILLILFKIFWFSLYLDNHRFLGISVSQISFNSLAYCVNEDTFTSDEI